jgi:Ca-activated chloride channel family protein
MTTHTITLPVHVNVVPGDEAAGRIPDPVVRTELAFQQAQSAKRRAADALREGDAQAAAQLYRAAGDELQGAAASAPDEQRPDLDDEVDLLRALSERAIDDDARRVTKFSDSDVHRKQRKRGR